VTTVGRANPYVGPRSFERGEQLHGRERELRELTRLLVAERIVLCHSPSGAGKTSLIQASLIPTLEMERRFTVYPIVRVNLEPPEQLGSASANRYVLSVLRGLEATRPPGEQIELTALAAMTLHDYITQRAPAQAALDDRVVIFDQFEEIITVEPMNIAAKTEFFTQLGALLRRDEGLWALFALREEFVATLAPYLDYIPRRFRTTYRLPLLDREMAVQAIRNPALRAGLAFDFEAAARLADDLCRVRMDYPDGRTEFQTGMFVEPVQLQVVCYRLWSRLDPDATAIGEADIAIQGDVNSALAEFYNEQIALIVEQTGYDERAIRDWVDQKLITPEGIRTQVLQGRDQSEGLPNKVVLALVATHLVRSERQRGAAWLELAHDRLIEPVRAANSVFREANLSAAQRQATLWEQENRPARLLLHSQALAEAEAWAEANAARVSPIERAFIQTSRRASDATRRARQRFVLGVLIVASLILVLITINAVSTARTAEAGQATAVAGNTIAAAGNATAQQAVSNERVARATAAQGATQARAEQQTAVRLASIANAQTLVIQAQAALPRDPELSMLVALRAAEYDASAQVADTLREATFAFPLYAVLAPPDSDANAAVRWLAFGAERRLVAGTLDGTVLVWEYDPRRERWRDPPAVLSGHTDTITSGAISSDGARLVTASADRTARVWDLARGNLLAVVGGHGAPLTTAQFSPDGTLLLTTAEDGAVKLSDAGSGTEIRELRGHTGSVVRASFVQNGQLVLTASTDGSARLVSVADGQELRAFTGGGGPLTDMALSGDGMLVATAAGDGTARLFDVDTGDLRAIVAGHTAPLTAVRFSPDNTRLLTASEDGTARLFDVASGRQLPVLAGHSGAVTAATFSPGGRAITTASADGTVRIWDVATARALFVLPGAGGAVQHMAWEGEGEFLATSTDASGVRIWRHPLAGDFDLGTDPPLERFALSPDAGTLLLVRGGQIALWSHDTTTAAPLGPPRAAPIGATVFSADGRLLLTVEGATRAQLWDTTTGASQTTLESPAAILSGSFSADGTRVVTVGADAAVRVWDAASGDELGAITPYSGPPQLAVLNPDGALLLTVEGAEAQLWQVAGGVRIARLTGHGDAITGAAWSPDGQRLVTISADRTGRIWGGRGEASPTHLEGHEDGLTDVAWSPDGQVLATVSGDGTARLWLLSGPPASSSVEMRVLRHPATTITSVAFDPTGEVLITGSSDGLVRLWGRGSDRSLGQLYSHAPGLTQARFEPTGGIVTLGSDGHVRWYRCPICAVAAEVRHYAEGLPYRRLSESEQRLFEGLIVLEDRRQPAAPTTSPTPTPSPSPSSTRRPSPTRTRTPRPTSTSVAPVVPTGTSVPPPLPTATLAPTSIPPSPTETPSPTLTLTPTRRPNPPTEESPLPTPSRQATATGTAPTPSSTPSPYPPPDVTPEPEETSVTPEPEETSVTPEPEETSVTPEPEETSVTSDPTNAHEPVPERPTPRPVDN